MRHAPWPALALAMMTTWGGLTLAACQPEAAPPPQKKEGRPLPMGSMQAGPGAMAARPAPMRPGPAAKPERRIVEIRAPAPAKGGAKKKTKRATKKTRKPKSKRAPA